MPFRLAKALAKPQKTLDINLFGTKWKTRSIYLDDFIVFSKSVEEHLCHVAEIIRILESAHVLLKLSKCEFFRTKATNLGYAVKLWKLETEDCAMKSL